MPTNIAIIKFTNTINKITINAIKISILDLDFISDMNSQSIMSKPTFNNIAAKIAKGIIDA